MRNDFYITTVLDSEVCKLYHFVGIGQNVLHFKFLQTTNTFKEVNLTVVFMLTKPSNPKKTYFSSTYPSGHKHSIVTTVKVKTELKETRLKKHISPTFILLVELLYALFQTLHII